MVNYKAILFLIIALCIVGCVSFETGFREAHHSKINWLVETYGAGSFYTFDARGSDLRAVSPERSKQYDKKYGIMAITVLIDKSTSKPELCRENYVALNETFTYYEGGSASIGVRCRGN